MFKNKKVIGIIVGILIVAFVIFCIVQTNITFALEDEKPMHIGEEVVREKYSITVKDYEIVSNSDMQKLYPGSKEILTSQNEDNGVEMGDAILVHCVMNFKDKSKGFPYGDFNLDSGSFRQGISAELFHLINKEFKFSQVELNKDYEIIFPFDIYTNQLRSGRLDEVQTMKIRLVCCLNPLIYVQLDKE